MKQARQSASRDKPDAITRAAVLTIVCAFVALFVGLWAGTCSANSSGVESVKQIYSFPDGGSGSDSIATGGLYRGTALYDITLSTKAHLIVLYDNTTQTSSIVAWPDPTSPETGYLYVNPLDRDEVLRRIRDREDKDERAKDGENVYSFRMTRSTTTHKSVNNDSAVETTSTVRLNEVSDDE